MEAVIRARSAREPAPQASDIRSLERLRDMVGQVVKTTWDGKEWSYRLITGPPQEYAGVEFGYPCFAELFPNAGGGWRCLTDVDFDRRGLVVRKTEARETRNLQFPAGSRPRLDTRRYRLRSLIRGGRNSHPPVPVEVFDQWRALRDGVSLPTEVSPESAAAAKWWASHFTHDSAPLRDQRAQFETELARRIEAVEPDSEGKKRIDNTFSQAHQTLELSARSAGIDRVAVALPAMTDMWIQHGSVVVTDSYGRNEVIFSEISAASTAAAKWWADHLPGRSDKARAKRAAFEAELARQIEAMEPYINRGKLLHVEYPDATPAIELAARVAGIENCLKLLPNRTSMLVGPSSVEVSTFHGAGREMIFANVSPESAAAAKWWAKSIPETSRAEHAMHEQFEIQLARRIGAMHPDESGSKQISADHWAVDEVLELSAASAGITNAKDVLPQRIMVVEPGRVSLRSHEGFENGVVFRARGPGVKGIGTAVVL
jgi:hypothetical protein